MKNQIDVILLSGTDAASMRKTLLATSVGAVLWCYPGTERKCQTVAEFWKVTCVQAQVFVLMSRQWEFPASLKVSNEPVPNALDPRLGQKRFLPRGPEAQVKPRQGTGFGATAVSAAAQI